MPVAEREKKLITGRLTNYPFAQQVTSVYRTRQQEPKRTVEWFDYLEKNPDLVKTGYVTLDDDQRGMFRILQKTFEVVRERRFLYDPHPNLVSTGS